MVTFFQEDNPPRVWDKVKCKVTAVFQNGEFETEDPALIDLLVRVGYRHNGVLPGSKSQSTVKSAGKASKPKMVRKKK